eukprot:10249929-Prorocentrum_lima.AAC.1
MAGTQWPLLHLRLWKQACFSQKVSWAVLFVDVASAFSHVSRFLLFGSTLQPAAWSSYLHSQGHDAEGITFLVEQLTTQG